MKPAVSKFVEVIQYESTHIPEFQLIPKVTKDMSDKARVILKEKDRLVLLTPETYRYIHFLL